MTCSAMRIERQGCSAWAAFSAWPNRQTDEPTVARGRRGKVNGAHRRDTQGTFLRTSGKFKGILGEENLRRRPEKCSSNYWTNQRTIQQSIRNSLSWLGNCRIESRECCRGLQEVRFQRQIKEYVRLELITYMLVNSGKFIKLDDISGNFPKLRINQ